MNRKALVSVPSAGPDSPRWSETLRNGRRVLIRPITPMDAAAERAFIDGLSAEAKRFRFLGAVRSPSDAMIRQFTDIDYVHDVAFAAVVEDDSRERIVGVGRYSTAADGRACECAVTVSEEWQHQGLGTLLLKHLIEVARAHDIRTMVSIDSAENTRMADLARHLGFDTRTDPDDASLVIHELVL